MTEQPETVFPALMGMTDLGAASIGVGHLEDNGFVEITLGTAILRFSVASDDLADAIKSFQQVHDNLIREADAKRRLQEDDGSDAFA